MSMNKRKTTKTLMTAVGLSSMMAFGAAANQCETVRFSDIGWTDVTSTTAITTEVLKGIGYTTETDLLSLPVTFSSLASGDIDVFLGNWMPTQTGDIKKYIDNGTVDSVRANLTGAKYTLAVPKYVYDAGVKSVADIAEYADKFDSRIYGIEPGNDGNTQIQKMIDTDDFDLGDFRLIESSEAGMISQVSRAVRRDKWVAFLGWAPHPMNSNFDMKYLSGADEYFGPNYGGATVHTNVRSGYVEQCANVGQMLENLEFSLKMENEMMGKILNDGEKPQMAAREWLRNNPSVLNKWLDGVTTVDGQDAVEAVTEYLKKTEA
ncbi:choline ABC transporter substrate-binding protein [Salinivibrio sp. IB643]|uniref:choline ABC transporter substrate-binding protein n=1 Tax=Salinivibrio sp. IB643 TaxID=1909445 RepID=UPI0009897387|nr:choline ABC transporter substrate-binding protein [Salinivibrio sp. IB643]OOE98052.1 glycine/betaine ABC transporter substrate-binding protein [Salinivibrio sp. IB643]